MAAFSDTIYQWLGKARAMPPVLPVLSASDVQDLLCDLRGRLLVAVSDPGALGPYGTAQAITANDSATYGPQTPAWRGVMSNATGLAAIVVATPDGGSLSSVVQVHMNAGVIYPFFVYAVMATGTDSGLQAANNFTLFL